MHQLQTECAKQFRFPTKKLTGKSPYLFYQPLHYIICTTALVGGFHNMIA